MLGDLASGELNDMFEELSPQKIATVFIIVNNIIGALSHKRFRAKYIDEISDSIKSNYINVSFDFISK